MKTMKLSTLIATALLTVALSSCASTETPVTELTPKTESKSEVKTPPPQPASDKVARLKQLVEASKTKTLTLEEWKEIGELSGWSELSDSAGKALKERTAPPRKADLVTELINAKEHGMQLQTSFDAANAELKARAAEMEALIKRVDELSKGESKAADLEDIAKAKEESRKLQRENDTLKERVKALEEAASEMADTQKLKSQVNELKIRIERLKLEYVAPERHQAALDDAQRLRGDNSAIQAENAGLKQALAEARARGDEACKFTEQLTARFDDLSRKYERMNEYLRKKN